MNVVYDIPDVPDFIKDQRMSFSSVGDQISSLRVRTDVVLVDPSTDDPRTQVKRLSRSDSTPVS